MENKKTISEKAYKKELRQIYKESESYEQKIKKFYLSYEIKDSWKVNRIQYLRNTDKKYIGMLTLIISSLLSALITSLISSESIKGVLDTKKTSVIFTSFAFVMLLMFIICLIIAGFTLMLTTPFVMGTISAKEMKKRNLEIDIIAESLRKSSLKELLEKQNKKILLRKFISEILIGCIVSVVASVIIWFLPY